MWVMAIVLDSSDHILPLNFLSLLGTQNISLFLCFAEYVKFPFFLFFFSPSSGLGALYPIFLLLGIIIKVQASLLFFCISLSMSKINQCPKYSVYYQTRRTM